METRANYALIGLFMLAVTAGAFVFVYWFSRAGEGGDRAIYRVVFDGAVSGLRTGGAVFFNGIKVGEVSDLKLNSQIRAKSSLLSPSTNPFRFAPTLKSVSISRV